MTDELSQDTRDKIAVENNTYSNKLRLIIVATACVGLLLFVIGVIFNSIKYGTPLEGGIVSTTIAPLIDLFKIISGV